MVSGNIGLLIMLEKKPNLEGVECIKGNWIIHTVAKIWPDTGHS